MLHDALEQSRAAQRRLIGHCDQQVAAARIAMFFGSFLRSHESRRYSCNRNVLNCRRVTQCMGTRVRQCSSQGHSLCAHSRVNRRVLGFHQQMAQVQVRLKIGSSHE